MSMLLCFWPALNPLSIHPKYTAIVPGAYPGEEKNVQKCAKMANIWTYRLNYWETVEVRWVHAALRLTSIESLFSRLTFTAIVPGAYPGEAKMCLRLIAELQAFIGSMIISLVLKKVSVVPTQFIYVILNEKEYTSSNTGNNWKFVLRLSQLY